ncbi:hypothetical protein ARMGADRAFT_1035344 [Armillaria gallica]|uniref:Uncharacterized protein n=1 Tax=Armillaria gallica TaxID=47427 RepID=A0A2H3D5V6_ARMGA|nr:hypothetical protein ARMGADRAFT_1035344 [Armillaria gallica]
MARDVMILHIEIERRYSEGVNRQGEDATLLFTNAAYRVPTTISACHASFESIEGDALRSRCGTTGSGGLGQLVPHQAARHNRENWGRLSYAVMIKDDASGREVCGILMLTFPEGSPSFEHPQTHGQPGMLGNTTSEHSDIVFNDCSPKLAGITTGGACVEYDWVRVVPLNGRLALQRRRVSGGFEWALRTGKGCSLARAFEARIHLFLAQQQASVLLEREITLGCSTDGKIHPLVRAPEWGE